MKSKHSNVCLVHPLTRSHLFSLRLCACLLYFWGFVSNPRRFSQCARTRETQKEINANNPFCQSYLHMLIDLGFRIGSISNRQKKK